MYRPAKMQTQVSLAKTISGGSNTKNSWRDSGKIWLGLLNANCLYNEISTIQY